ncbi:hypothetical protein [Mycolicibacterium sp.]|uniref:hypothetical protein n=1 Tax=Mycolicibacterium sp. TaxID=2320850 RepID=UPI003560E942
MTTLLRGTALRYVLTDTLTRNGRMTVTELVEELARLGFAVPGRPSKTVSDALRWEVLKGRVYPRGRGRYGPGEMPRSTEYRIGKRVAALRKQALRELALRDGT